MQANLAKRAKTPGESNRLDPLNKYGWKESLHSIIDTEGATPCRRREPRKKLQPVGRQDLFLYSFIAVANGGAVPVLFSGAFRRRHGGPQAFAQEQKKPKILVIGEAKNSLEMNRRTIFADSLVLLLQLAYY